MPYSAPSSKSTGDLISAADWNTNTISNPAYLKGRLDYGYLNLVNGKNATTSGASVNGSIETSSDKVNLTVADFDASTIEYMSWQFALPADYDGGTITYTVYYTHAASTDDEVVWTLQGVCFADGETLDRAFGAGVDVTKSSAGVTANVLHVTAESGAVTLAGTPAAGKLCVLRLSRKASDGADTLNVDARFILLLVKYGRA